MDESYLDPATPLNTPTTISTGLNPNSGLMAITHLPTPTITTAISSVHKTTTSDTNIHMTTRHPRNSRYRIIYLHQKNLFRYSLTSTSSHQDPLHFTQHIDQHLYLFVGAQYSQTSRCHLPHAIDITRSSIIWDIFR